ncbi:MAG: M1 family metallopeptidase, partial [Candidatus Promineifilaceae bacterium]
SFGDNECPQSIVLAFLDDPSAPIDSSCVADMQPLEFTLPLTSEETSNDETAAQVTEPIVIDDNAGASGLGDSLYPEMGNGGYDVKHYTLDLAVDVVNNELDATVTIKAETIQLLSAFNLDLRGLFVERVTVDGVEVNFGRNGDELTIQPATPLPADTLFTVVIDYNGSPQSFRDPALSFTEIGWTEFNGGIFVFGEPSGAKTWYPSNNHPQDKATFTFNITTDSTYTVAATGRLVEEIENGDETTVTWEMSSPMATYLAAIYIGDFVREESVTDSGILIRNYFPPTLSSAEKADFAQTADVIAYYSDLFGPYPFDVYGSIVVDGELGFALENQTLSIHGRDATDIYTIAHEIMHQWTGNNLSLGDWQDIWLNEGFAFYIPFLYLDATGQTDIDRLMG